jgi:hypothetical protein
MIKELPTSLGRVCVRVFWALTSLRAFQVVSIAGSRVAVSLLSPTGSWPGFSPALVQATDVDALSDGNVGHSHAGLVPTVKSRLGVSGGPFS